MVKAEEEVSRDSLSSTGALRSLTTPTFFSLAPLWMSDSSAPLPLVSELLSLGGVVLACGGDGHAVRTDAAQDAQVQLPLRAVTALRLVGPAQKAGATHLTEGWGRRRPRGRGRRGRNGHPVRRLARLSAGWRLPALPSPLARRDARQRLLRTQQNVFLISTGCLWTPQELPRPRPPQKWKKLLLLLLLVFR